MSQYSQEILKVVVAKICQTIGWHSIQTTPLEIMVDILRRYLSEITKHTQSYATLFGHTQPNLDELGLAFRDLHINIADLEEYVRYVESGPPIESPLFPIPKESHLNFLKPGSGEVVTRPVHVNEHLPPMFKITEEAELVSQVKQEECSLAPNTDSNQSAAAVFKRPADISPNEPSIKRPRLVMEEEGRPTREISSVMMTTSGFLSPAREGKLPEARTPISAIEIPPAPAAPITPSSSPAPFPSPTPLPSASSAPNTGNNQSNALNEARFERKPPKVVREPKKLEKRKDKMMSKELFKPDDFTPPAKKVSPTKDVARTKATKQQANISSNNNINNNNNNNTLMPPHPAPHGAAKPVKSSPAKMKSQIKQQISKQTEKQVSISPVPPITPNTMQKPPQMMPDKIVEGKLSSEPDKSKLNIFKKISKVKDEKLDKQDKHKMKEEPIDLESRESSPDLIIDENHWEHKMNKQMLNEPVKASTPDIKNSPPPQHHSSEKDYLYDDDLSPPGTPSTPKTPEMPTHSPPQKSEKDSSKRKRKEQKTPKIKNKQAKMSRNILSPRRKNDSGNYEAELERPKTPNDPINMVMKDEMLSSMPQTKTPVFNLFPGLLPSGPGLIPPPMANSLFPRLPLTGAGLPKHGFGQPAHITPAMPVLPPFGPVPPLPAALNQMPFRAQAQSQQTPMLLDQVTIEKIPPVQSVDNQQQQQQSQQVKKLHLNDCVITPTTTTTTTKEKHKKDKKDKPKKKNKKDKIKNKSEKRKLKEEKKEKDKMKKKDKKKDKEREQQHEGSVPKLTLKIGSPRPPTPDVQIARKIMIKPVVKKDEDQVAPPSTTTNTQEKREPSPELARISALITRPPKLKTSTKPVNDHHAPNPSLSPSSNFNDQQQQQPIPTFHAKLKKNMFRSVPKIKNRDRERERDRDRDRERDRDRDRERKQRDIITTTTTDDVNDLHAQSYLSSSPPRIIDSPQKDLTIPAPSVAAAPPTAFYTDNYGNKVWICPACGGQDDGSPMIGCDDCDAWYHWVCVGIQVPPDDNEDWYCRICIVKKQETIQMDKKKKRKKKERKEH